MSERTRRQYLLAVGTATTAALAGCPGGDNGDDETPPPADDDGGDGNDAPVGPTATPTVTSDLERESIGTIEELTIPELAAVGYTSTVDGEDFVVTLTLENQGDQETEFGEYNIDLSVYDDSDEELATTVRYTASGLTAPAGERVEIPIRAEPLNTDPGSVASYGIRINCDGANGVYCE